MVALSPSPAAPLGDQAEPKHTPGPNVSLRDTVADQHGFALGNARGAYTVPLEDYANARLWAAAPEMLAALQKLDDYWTEDFPKGPDADDLSYGLGVLSEDTLAVWRAARAAIRLALTGEREPSPDASLVGQQLCESLDAISSSIAGDDALSGGRS